MAKTPIRIMLAALKSGKRICTSCGVEKPFDSFSKCSKERLGIRSRCKQCTQVESKSAYARNLESERLRARVRSITFRVQARQRLAAWRKANPEKDRVMATNWRRKNPDKVRATQDRSNRKRLSTARGRLHNAVKAMMHAGLVRGAKGGKKTFDLLGYSIDDLKKHLELYFQPGMSWDNYGRGGWEVDHIIPISAFNFDSPSHLDFKNAWALSNLQPLWQADNRRKQAKLTEPFQPSLALG